MTALERWLDRWLDEKHPEKWDPVPIFLAAGLTLALMAVLAVVLFGAMALLA